MIFLKNKEFQQKLIQEIEFTNKETIINNDGDNMCGIYGENDWKANELYKM